MGKIFYIMGKSASGKDSIYRMLLQKKELNLKRIIPYTTRPARNGEEQGREYYFVDEERYRELREEGKLIESRAYETVHGVWIYFTADDGQIDLKRSNFLAIGTLESYQKMRDYFGSESICPIYVEVEDGERLMRALIRERESRSVPDMRRCAGDSWRMRKIFQRRRFKKPASDVGLSMTTARYVWLRLKVTSKICYTEHNEYRRWRE